VITFRADGYKDSGGRLYLEVPADYHDLVLGYLENLRGKPYQIRISRVSRPRSTGPKSQQNHFYGHCRQIAVETGNDLDMVYFAVARRACSQGYPFKKIDGKVVISMFDQLPEPKPEPESTSAEAAILIEATHQVAAEFGIRLIEESEGEE